MDKIPEKVLAERITAIVECSTLTGSRCYDIAKADSDWDYLVSFETYTRLILPEIEKFTLFEDLAGVELEGHYEFDQEDVICYISFGDKKYNFIVVPNIDAWIWTTKIICWLPKWLILNKKRRVKIFRFCLAIHAIFGTYCSKSERNGDIF